MGGWTKNGGKNESPGSGENRGRRDRDFTERIGRRCAGRD